MRCHDIHGAILFFQHQPRRIPMPAVEPGEVAQAAWRSRVQVKSRCICQSASLAPWFRTLLGFTRQAR